MKAYFDISWSSLKNRFSLHSVVRNKTSKQVPIAILWFFNGNLIWQFSNEAKTEKMVTQNRLLLQKIQKNAPKIAQTVHLKSGNGPLRIYPLFVTTLDCFCGTLVGKTELKCTKNFKAVYLNLTKCNWTGFWRFGTDMYANRKVIIAFFF